MRIETYALVFLSSLIWVFCTTTQTRLIAEKRHYLLIGIVAAFTSAVWVFLVRAVAVTPDVAVVYIAGTAIGAAFSQWVKSRY
jgi:hypothetical protein